MTRPTFPQRFSNLDAARALFGTRVDRLGAFLWKSDPLADDLIALFDTLPRDTGWKLFGQALEEGIDALTDPPEALIRFFEQVDHVPLWVEDLLHQRAGRILHRSSVFSGLILALKSLVFGYAAPAGNKPLVLAGGLVERAPRRLNETANFVHEVCLPGGMQRDGKGFAITLKVRLMHAQVRRLILKSGSWDELRWGHPINQHDMLATTQLFSTSLLNGLEQLGFDIAHEESELYMLLWRYVGYLMGVEPELLVSSYDAGMRLSELIVMTQGPPDEDSRALVNALIMAGPTGAPTPELRRKLRRRLPFTQGMCRALIGDEMADGLGLPDTRWKHSLSAVRAVVRRAESVRKRIPGADRLAVRAGIQHWESVVSHQRSIFTYQPPSGLRGVSRARS